MLVEQIMLFMLKSIRFAYCLYRESSEWFTLDENLIEFINERNEKNAYIEKQGEKLFIYSSIKNIP